MATHRTDDDHQADEAERLETQADELYQRAELARAAGDHALADDLERQAVEVLARADELDPSPPALVAYRTPDGLVIEHLDAA